MFIVPKKRLSFIFTRDSSLTLLGVTKFFGMFKQEGIRWWKLIVIEEKHKKTIQIELCYSTQQIKEWLGFEIHYEKKRIFRRGGC